MFVGILTVQASYKTQTKGGASQSNHRKHIRYDSIGWTRPFIGVLHRDRTVTMPVNILLNVSGTTRNYSTVQASPTSNGKSVWTPRVIERRCNNQCSPIFFMGWEISHPAHFQWDGMGMGAEGSQWAMGGKWEKFLKTGWEPGFYNGCNVGISRCNYRLSNWRFGCE